MSLARCCAAFGMAVACAVIAAPGRAQDYPTRPIRMVVGFAPGGNTDVLARLLAGAVRDRLGQTVVIENKPAANGAIAAETIAKAEPDGYSLFMSTVGAVAINPGLRKDLPYDPMRDFAPIMRLGVQSPVLVLDPSLGINTAADLVARAKAKPGAITIGITGVGAISHLGLELFESASGARFTKIPYRGSGPALSDLLGSHVNGIIIDPAVLVEHIRAGKVRVMGSTAAKRSPLLPNIPTLVEQGYADVVAENWTGLLAPARTPQPIISKLNAAFTGALKDSQVLPKMEASGIAAAPTTPEEFGALVKSEIERWARVIREKGITTD
ncbi:MAG TPA: tripartite tricarboxylate transporter substrate binding protein [Xanthobacteraceae bacterium]